jgi:uncharacterized protein YndB with AHSA1/START domain
VKRLHIDVAADTTAPASTVYALLVESATWPRWSPMDSVEIERPGTPPPDGVGAIRVNRKGRTVGRDEIVELVANERFVYRSLSGVPVRDYFGDVTLEPTDEGGTRIRWHSSFFAKTRGTGWLLRRGLTKFLRDCVDGLATAASTQPLSERRP